MSIETTLHDPSSRLAWLEQRLAGLEQAVAELDANRQIAQLIASYGPLVDTADTPEQALQVADLWTETGVYDIDGFGRKVGHASIAQSFEGLHANMVREGVAHVLGPPVIQLEGDHATAYCYSTVFRRGDDQYYVWRVSVNRWELVRQNGCWKVMLRTNRLVTGRAEALDLLRTLKVR